MSDRSVSLVSSAGGLSNGERVSVVLLEDVGLDVASSSVVLVCMVRESSPSLS